MTFAGGSTTVNANIIQSTIASALQMPGAMPVAPAAPVAPVAPVQQVAPVQPVAPVRPPIIPNVSQALTDAAKAIDVPNFEDPAPIVDKPIEVAPVDDDADLPNTPAAENFKRLRDVVKGERAAKKELEVKYQEKLAALERYEKGEVVPQVIQAKDQRIAQLEPYEKIVNLKLSPEYQEGFVQPAMALRGDLEKLGDDYGIPPHIMHQAVEITNRKELNQFLSQHFDDVGALEVKRVVGELQELGEQALQAEQEPVHALQTLKQQFAARQAEEATQRAVVFESTAKDAWNAALEKTRAEGAYKELILSPTNPEYNRKVVEPIQARAATQYGALVKKLAENGLKQLPPELALGLARMVQLSIGGALSLEAKVNAEKNSQQILANTQRVNPYIRPNIGGQNGAGNTTRAQSAGGPVTPAEAAKLAAARSFGS